MLDSNPNTVDVLATSRSTKPELRLVLESTNTPKMVVTLASAVTWGENSKSSAENSTKALGSRMVLDTLAQL